MTARPHVRDPGIVVAAKRQRRRRGEVATTLLEPRQGGQTDHVREWLPDFDPWTLAVRCLLEGRSNLPMP
jgi:hypothetical protein